jgi:hypothetical protein
VDPRASLDSVQKRRIFSPHQELNLDGRYFNIFIRSSAVAKALCYKPKGCVFETQRGERIFSIYIILLAALDPGVHSACKRNEYQKQKNNVSGEWREAGA